MRRLIQRCLLLCAVSTLAVAIYALWPWLVGIPTKFGPLRDYRVYEIGIPVDGYPDSNRSGWREPTSRWELLTRRDTEILAGHKTVERIHRLSKQFPRPLFQRPIEPMQTRGDDKLEDFVIEFGDSFGYPESQEQLKQAISRGDAQRASSFFTFRYLSQKPFYGQLATSLAYQNSDYDHGNLRVAELEIQKDFKTVKVRLETPKRPEVFIVAASGFTNAKQAAYVHASPVVYDNDEYWAVIYAGSTQTDFRAFNLDRITIGKSSSEILLDATKSQIRDSERYPYWFFVPLGHLPDGPYSISVRIAESDDILATTTANLRHATDHETITHSADNGEQRLAAARLYEQRTNQEQSHGAALQLRLQRLANFVHSPNLLATDRKTLTDDAVKLGAAVDWNLNLFNVPQARRCSLASPTFEEIVGQKRPGIEEQDGLPGWTDAKISLRDVWLCDGTDARWYASQTYRNVPEFDESLTAEKLSPIQEKIRAIWSGLKKQASEPRSILKSFPVKGSINDALETAFEVIVEGKEPTKSFSPKDQVWVVFIAKRSFVIRGIRERTYQVQFNKTTRKEFVIDTSAYIAEADDVAEADWAPVTFGLIPLGRCTEDSVGLMFSCMAICARDPRPDKAVLVDAIPPENLFNDYRNYVGQTTGFKISH